MRCLLIPLSLCAPVISFPLWKLWLTTGRGLTDLSAGWRRLTTGRTGSARHNKKRRHRRKWLEAKTAVHMVMKSLPHKQTAHDIKFITRTVTNPRRSTDFSFLLYIYIESVYVKTITHLRTLEITERTERAIRTKRKNGTPESQKLKEMMPENTERN